MFDTRCAVLLNRKQPLNVSSSEVSDKQVEEVLYYLSRDLIPLMLP